MFSRIRCSPWQQLIDLWLCKGKSRQQIPFHELDLKNAEKIGGGTYGTVYKTRWNGCNVAVKVVKFDNADEANRQATRSNVLNEAKFHE